MHAPKVGQVWADMDTRAAGRLLLIVGTVPSTGVPVLYVRAEVVANARQALVDRVGDLTMVKAERLVPGTRGYRLLGDIWKLGRGTNAHWSARTAGEAVDAARKGGMTRADAIAWLVEQEASK